MTAPRFLPSIRNASKSNRSKHSNPTKSIESSSKDSIQSNFSQDVSISSTILKNENNNSNPSMKKQNYVYIRIKRKRNEDPLDNLIVEGNQATKRAATVKSIGKAMETLCTSSNLMDSTDNSTTISNKQIDSNRNLNSKAEETISNLSQRFVFSRVDTVGLDETKQPQGSRRLARKLWKTSREFFDKKESIKKTRHSLIQNNKKELNRQIFNNKIKSKRYSEIQQIRGLLSENDSKKKQNEYCFVDLAPIDSDLNKTISTISNITMNGQQLKKTKNSIRILNPMEQELDQAIWYAFCKNEFQWYYQVLKRGMIAKPWNFQRPIDGLTMLMAASHNGRADQVDQLLQMEGILVSIQCHQGYKASDYANMSNNQEISKALKSCEELEMEKDYVYDVYCMDSNASKLLQNENEHIGNEKNTSMEISSTYELNNAPIATVSATIENYLHEYQEIEGEMNEFMYDSDWSDHEIIDDDIDSNDEDYHTNDYPDEESSDDDSDYDEYGLRMPYTRDLTASEMGIWNPKSSRSLYNINEDGNDEDDSNDEGNFSYF